MSSKVKANKKSKSETPKKSTSTNDIDHIHGISSSGLYWMRLIFFLCHVLYLSKTIYQHYFISQSKYLTMWGFYFLIIYFGLHLYLAHFGSKDGNKKLKHFLNILCEITYAVEVLITIFFWLFLYEIVKNKYLDNPYFLQEQIYLHGFCFITIALDCFFNNYQFENSRISHILLLTVVYGGFNAAYSLIVAPIYEVITYRRPADYLFVVVAFLLFLGGFGIGKIQVRLRRAIYEKPHKE